MWKKFVFGLQMTSDYFADEIKIIMHDAGAVLIFIVAMVAYPLLYSLGYMDETIREIPIAVVDMDHSQISRQYSRMADATEQLKVVYKPQSLKDAEQLFYDGKINGVILIPKDFEKDIYKGQQTNVTVYCDASYFLLYKQVYSGAIYSTGTLGAGVEIKHLLAQGNTIKQAMDKRNPLNVNTYNLYNPDGGYGTFVIPGILIVILQQTLLIGIGLIGGTIRERRRYIYLIKPAQLPGGSFVAVMGKTFAYIFIYLFNIIFVLVMLHNWFHLPDKSGFLPTLFLIIPFLFATAFLGLAISFLFRRRVHSLLFMVFLSPTILFLTGMSWPVESLPPFLYLLAHIFPSTITVPAYIRMRIGGAGLSSVTYEWGFLLIQMVVYCLLACLTYKFAMKRLEKEYNEEARMHRENYELGHLNE